MKSVTVLTLERVVMLVARRKDLEPRPTRQWQPYKQRPTPIQHSYGRAAHPELGSVSGGVTEVAEWDLVQRVKEAQRLAMETFCRSSDYQRDLSKAIADFFLAGFEDCHAKVRQKYPKMNLGGVSTIDTPSTSQVADSPSTGDVKVLLASIREDDVMGD